LFACSPVKEGTLSLFFFFFQAEDGIRDLQGDWSSDVCSSDLSSCLLLGARAARSRHAERADERRGRRVGADAGITGASCRREERSEERRVGKECRSRWSPEREKKKKRRKKQSRSRERSCTCRS